MTDKHRLGLAAALAALALVAAGCGSDGDGGGGDGSGDDGLGSLTVAVGTAQTFEFLPAEFGLDLGVWEERGLQVENLYVQGSGQVAQAIAAGEADIGVTAGASGVDAILSGVESKIVGLIGADFRMMVLVVPEGSAIQSIDDLQDTVVGVTSAGSLTDYLARTITVHQGWPEDAIQRANIGGLSEQLAALESGATDAFVWSVEAGFALEEEGSGQVLLDFGQIVTENVFEDIVASQPAIDEREDAVRAYLEGWYETVRHMKDNRDETVAVMVEEFEVSENVAAKTYDHDIDNLSTDGTIPQANLEGLAQSVVEQGIADEVPAIDVFWDDRFVPVDG
ncbi:MAG: PhnD/SsuA/transferrin family substrate-binding protein [Micromonosporaceae bacterium]|nr:PhnD/SsuA/transferrin family substrate-binding protein [Micromonosporaceae bacterium]